MNIPSLDTTRYPALGTLAECKVQLDRALAPLREANEAMARWHEAQQAEHRRLVEGLAKNFAVPSIFTSSDPWGFKAFRARVDAVSREREEIRRRFIERHGPTAPLVPR